MKFFTLTFVLIIIAGCQHTKPNVVATPSDKVTETTTVTRKVEHPVPVYNLQTKVTTATQTKTSDGRPAAPLHSATITDVPQATFKVNP